MTYIKLENDGRLIVTQKDTIYRGENMSKAITFLIPKIYEEQDLTNASIFLSYIRNGGNPDIVSLDPQPEMYNSEYCEYVLPVTCKLSRYVGEIVMWLQICSSEPSEMAVLKSGDCRIYVSDSTNLDNCLSDHQLSVLYQMKKQIDELSNDSESGDCEWEDMTGEDTDSSDDAYWEDM